MPTVLLVEDDPDMRELECLMLNGEGHEVLVASNGREALEALRTRRPCIILLDLMMPVMDGLTFLAERARRGLALGVPVVCVTAATPEIQREAIRLGARDCLAKPMELDHICGVVSHYCGGRSGQAC